MTGRQDDLRAQGPGRGDHLDLPLLPQRGPGAVRPHEHEHPEGFGFSARRVVEEFKVAVMGAPAISTNPDSKTRQVMEQSVERVSIGELQGVDLQVRACVRVSIAVDCRLIRSPPTHPSTPTTSQQFSTKAIWDIYQRIALEISDPVHKMLQWFEAKKAPRIDAVRTSACMSI